MGQGGKSRVIDWQVGGFRVVGRLMEQECVTTRCYVVCVLQTKADDPDTYSPSSMEV